MRVFIYKFYSNRGIEERVGKLVHRVGKRWGNNLKVVCVDKEVCQSLEAAGIQNEFFKDFDINDNLDEVNWERFYKISDELQSSVPDNPKFCPAYYIYIIRIGNLLKELRDKGFDTVIVIIPTSYSTWVRDINTKNIKTIRDDRDVISFVKRLWYHIQYQAKFLFMR